MAGVLERVGQEPAPKAETMTYAITVLDHGYVLPVEHWGSDERVVEAARMSTGKGFLGWGPKCKACGGDTSIGEHLATDCPEDIGTEPGDEKLLRYLYENKHATPFEMAGLVIEVQAPIVVFREWHRHRTQSYNEMSARYNPLPDINYVPTVDRLMMGVGHPTKQAGTVVGAETLTIEAAEDFRSNLTWLYRRLDAEYREELLRGVPKELARLLLPVGRYSKMRASANLRNWLSFLTLRDDPKAQWEIRQYAIAVRLLLEDLFPRTMALFNER